MAQIHLQFSARPVEPSGYYLAEAWIMKGNRMQATEFNRMAGIYLGNDTAWMLKEQRQKERIENIIQK